MLKSDPFPAFEFLKLGQLGQLFSLSATAVGTKLKQAGMRLHNGDPSDRAKDSGMTKLVQVEGMNPFWVWHKVKTVTLLEAAGLQRSIDGSASDVVRPELLAPLAETSTTPLVTPRETEASDEIDAVAQKRMPSIVARPLTSRPFEIVWPDGEVRAWVEGEALADQVAKILSLALRAGRLQ